MPEQISELTTNRLSLYLRFLKELEAQGVKTVSSKVLAEQFGLSAVLIRKDLAHFGDLGVRGVGYVVEDLKRELRSILGLDRRLGVAIIGAGNLGLALAEYPGFRQEGFRIVALFDNLRDKVGRVSRSGVTIYDIRDLKRVARREETNIAVIAVPEASARDVVRTGCPGRHHGDTQLLARSVACAGTRQAQERRPDGLAGKPVVLLGRGSGSEPEA